jgi:hypothetical protein
MVAALAGAYWLGDSGRAASFIFVALSSMFCTLLLKMPRQERSRHGGSDRSIYATIALSGAALFLAVTTLANPFPWATFQPTGAQPAVEGRLVRTTDSGAWLLTNSGQPKFYTGPLDTLTICGREFDTLKHIACRP